MSFLQLTLLTVLVACCCLGCHGQMAGMALPGFNLILVCPRGQEINITDTTAGPPEPVDKFHDLSISTEQCLDPGFLAWSKTVCDNLDECRLPKPEPEMLVCDKEEPFMMSALYRCENKFPDKHTVIACDGEQASLSCEKGVIEIIKSNYGRLDRNNCTDHPSNMTFCTSEDFGPVVSNTCEGLESCTVPVDPNSLSPPEHCDDFPKYAYISYICKE